MRCGAADFGSTGPQRLKLKICGFRSGANEIIQPALRALGLSLSDGAPTVGRGKTFLTGQLNFFTETAVTQERKVEKLFPRSEINLHAKG